MEFVKEFSVVYGFDTDALREHFKEYPEILASMPDTDDEDDWQDWMNERYYSFEEYDRLAEYCDCEEI